MEALRPDRFPERLKWLLMASAPVALFFLSFSVGRYPIEAGDLVVAVYHRLFAPSRIVDGRMATVLFNIRLPRVLSVMLVGAGLSVAGASYQGLFKNPIVSPDILGASAGAGLGAALGLLLGLNLVAIQLFALVSGIVAVLLTVLVNRTLSRDPLLGLVLGGIMISTLCSSFTSCAKLIADSDGRLPAITFWLMGGFHAMTRSKLLSILAPISLSLGILYAMSWKLNVLSFGEDEARSLGVEPRRVRLAVILAATLITASSVSVAGMVGWVGLVIPHLGRAIVGADYRALSPASALLGASYLLIVDDVVRNAASVEIPIGILTAILGVPFFLVIYRSSSRR